jgi:hypothetical protein
VKFLEYLVERTFYRPRDAILFVNACLEHSEDRNTITAQSVLNAEGEYSSRRLTSLQEEWGATFPNLTKYTRILISKPSSFKLSLISKELLQDLLFAEFGEELESADPVIRAISDVIMNGKGTVHAATQVLFEVFYLVGMVGIKPDSTSGTYWSFHNAEGPSSGAIKPSSTASIHPTFWRTLGTRLSD